MSPVEVPIAGLAIAAVLVFALGWWLRGVWWDIAQGARGIGGSIAWWLWAFLGLVGSGFIGWWLYTTQPWQ